MGYKPVEPAGDEGDVTMTSSTLQDDVKMTPDDTTPKVRKTLRLPKRMDDALKPLLEDEGISLNSLVISLLERWLGGNVTSLWRQNDVTMTPDDVTLKPIQEDIEVLRENIEILFNLNKNREEDIKELKKSIYELEAELRAYLLDRAEKGDISGEQKMEVEEE